MNLNINYGEMKTTGQNITAKSQEFGTLLSQIQQLNDNLKECWTGDDATSYTGKITEQAEIMKKLQTTINEVGVYLQKASDAYAQAMSENILK